MKLESKQGRNNSGANKKELIAMVAVPKENLENRDFKGLAQALFQKATASPPKHEAEKWSPEDEEKYGMFKEELGGVICDVDRRTIDISRQRGIPDWNIKATLANW